MRRIATILALCLLAAACGRTTTGAAVNPLEAVNAFKQADLANAISIAKAAGTTNPLAPMIVSCFTLAQSQVGTLAAMLTPPTGTVGLATAATVALLGVGNLNAVLSLPSQAQFATACGPLLIMVQNQGLTLAGQVAGLAGTVALLVPK